MTETTPAPGPEDRREQIARAFIAALPHSRALGMRLAAIGEGWAECEMDWRPDLVGDPETGVIHGGAVSALLDTSCGAAVMTHAAGAMGTATLDLRIDYMRPARKGRTIRARAECYHVTRSIAFVRATADDGERERPVASASGAFTLGGAP